jgi:prepilin-type N-terminal cleavage/methylation domain-containing protein
MGNRKKGFSLLELLIYMALLAMILVAVAAIFLAVNSGRVRNEVQSEVNANLRFAVDKIGSDLRSATSITTPASGVGPSGSLGAWSTTTALPVGRRDAVALVNNGYIYSLGHETADYYAKLNADGSVGAWSTTTNLPVALFAIAGAINNGYIYIAGGIPDYVTAPTSTVVYAKINATGSLGAWTQATPLPSGMDFSSFNEAFVNNGYIYTVGGAYNAAGNSTTTVFYAPINATGSLGAWSTTTPIPDAMFGHSVVFSGGYVYTIGGVNEDNPFYAHVNATGSLGAWSTGTAFPFQNVYGSSVVNNSYVYMTGGTTSSVVLPNVYYAWLNNVDGSLGTWSTTTFLPNGIDDHAATIGNNGYIYSLGGDDGTVNTSTVFYAPIN